jgi:hypothetical protein
MGKIQSAYLQSYAEPILKPQLSAILPLNNSKIVSEMSLTVTNMLYKAHTKNAFPLVELANVAELLSQGASIMLPLMSVFRF